MTTSEVPNRPTRVTPRTNPAHQPRPLSSYVRGTLRFHFAGGAVAEREETQDEARAVLAMQQDQRTNDEIDWDSLHWYQWQPAQLVFSSFDAHTDQNWQIAPDERDELGKAGHPHGVIASLVDYWRQKEPRTEPTYSMSAIVALHRYARRGIARETWEALAKILEGQSGATQMAKADRLDSVDDAGTASVNPNDVQDASPDEENEHHESAADDQGRGSSRQTPGNVGPDDLAQPGSAAWTESPDANSERGAGERASENDDPPETSQGGDSGDTTDDDR